jgi:type II secretion system protein C
MEGIAMNSLFKLESFNITPQAITSILVTLIIIFTAKLVTTIPFMFVSTSGHNYPLVPFKETPISLDMVSILELKEEIKQQPTTTTPTQTTKEPTHQNIVLKEFTLLATYVEKGNQFIMIADKGKSTIVSLEEEYNGYKLISIKPKIAKFTKNNNYYWLFEDPTMAEGYDFDEQKQKPKQTTTKTKEKSKLVVSKKNKDAINFENGTYYIPRAKVKEFDNINKIFKLIAISPSYENGKLNGFIVSKVKPNSVFSLLGLQKGDKIVEVDHNPLTKMEDGFYYFSKLDQMSSMTLTIIRDDKQKELSYEIF